jgi:hypothetical protein
MDAHYWLFPWLSLFASFSAAIGGVLLSRRPPDDVKRLPAISPWLIFVWLAAIVVMIAGGLKLGGWAIIDYIPARGVLAGALGGVVLSAVIRKQSANAAASSAAAFGFAVALICIARLWLTHGEVSGLMAAAFSAGATLLCFVAAPAVTDTNPSSINLCTTIAVFITALVGGVLLGFTRADTLSAAFWADIPLMIGAALSVGLLFAAALNRFGAFAKSIAVAGTTLAVLIPLGIVVTHQLPVIGITVLGAIAAALPLAIVNKGANKSLPEGLGFILLIAGITVAFSLLSGYGLALYCLGVLVVAAISSTVKLDSTVMRVEMPIGWSAFGVLLLVYRLEILQNGSSVRAIGPGDIWDLTAIALGILAPRLVAGWVSGYTPSRSWSTALQWLTAIVAPTLVLDYIWQPRTLTGLFLGLAVGQLFGRTSDNKGDSEISGLTSVLAGLLLFLFLPGLDQLTAPTRNVRVICIVVLSVIVAIKIIAHRPGRRIPAKAV